MKVLSKIFWRVVLPLVLAFALVIAWVLEFYGRMRQGIFSGSGGDPIVLYVSVALFIACLVVALRNTLQWGKEAEEYETDLEEADEIEKERRRRSSWVER